MVAELVKDNYVSYLGQLVDDHGDEPCIYHSLHLLLVPCGDVGQEPHGLL